MGAVQSGMGASNPSHDSPKPMPDNDAAETIAAFDLEIEVRERRRFGAVEIDCEAEPSRSLAMLTAKRSMSTP